ncbi:MAG: LCP family protein [Bifidobacteriaceae bacterium]|jgi:LCP family protein required for cell wall assembly|nr:LCP family protein [Bifidobacteriaceae bacterium]
MKKSPKFPRHAENFHKSSRFVTAILTIIAIIFGFSSFAAAMWIDINYGFKTINTSLMGENRVLVDPNAGNSMNILVLGVDSRGTQEDLDLSSDGNAQDAAGARSDTAILIHISSDRQRVEMVSIPRDSMVPVPQCQTTHDLANGQTIAMFNSAFANAYDLGQDLESGASCAAKTVEENTHVHIDGFVVADFAAFKNMVDALGGIKICIPQFIDAWNVGGLTLQKGIHTLNGRDATEYARAREGIGLGDGSDIDRIKRQQQVLGAIINKAMQELDFAHIPELYRLIRGATHSMTSTLNLQDYAGLAFSLRNTNMSNIMFYTVPWESYPEDPNRIQWTDKANEIWNRFIHDTPIIKPQTPSPAPNASVSPNSNSNNSSNNSTNSEINSLDEIQHQNAKDDFMCGK